jgi:hypothetical protein
VIEAAFVFLTNGIYKYGFRSMDIGYTAPLLFFPNVLEASMTA